jgi:hypothetical protein
MKKTPIIVETGNWKVRIKINMSDYEDENYAFIEAATQALENIFGTYGESSNEQEIISLLDNNGKDYFSSDYDGDTSVVPQPFFGVLTVCYIEKYKKNEKKWWYFLTTKLFENAAQPENVEQSIENEKKWATEVEDFLKKEKDCQKDLKNQKKKKK